MSSLESLLCNSCGAPLSVPAAANYVKCNHCQTQLHVRRDAGVTFTESVEQLNETTQALQKQVQRLTHQQDLAELDRRWESRKEEFMISGKDGRKNLPSETGAVVVGVVIVGFGLVWTTMAFGMALQFPSGGGVGLFPLFGLLFVGFGVYTSYIAREKARQYKKALAQYERERSQIISRDRG